MRKLRYLELFQNYFGNIILGTTAFLCIKTLIYGIASQYFIFYYGMGLEVNWAVSKPGSSKQV